MATPEAVLNLLRLRLRSPFLSLWFSTAPPRHLQGLCDLTHYR